MSTTALCPCTLEGQCRLEILEMNALWELCLINDGHELEENPHPTPQLISLGPVFEIVAQNSSAGLRSIYSL